MRALVAFMIVLWVSPAWAIKMPDPAPAPVPVPVPLIEDTRIELQTKDRALAVSAPRNDNGEHITIAWGDPVEIGRFMVVLRHLAPGKDRTAGFDEGWMEPPVITGPVKAGDALARGWTVAYFGDGDTEVVDEVPPGGTYVYVAYEVQKVEATGAEPERWIHSGFWSSEKVSPAAAWFNTDRWFFLLVIAFTGIAFYVYLCYARRNAHKIFIRRIPGIDAIEDAIGRSTEMGRPILYVTGVEEIQDIQTIASLLILGHVAEMTAEYDSEIKVANTYPMTMIVAEEIVRQGYANAGRLDAHKPENVMFITSEQFAFAAAVNGMILRDRPAANIYFGRFFAESLLLAETGFLTGAVQIAATAEFTQLPFFIAACDYTLLGEELYAVSAYLSREPTLLTQLKVGDLVKLLIMILIVVGTAIATWYGVDVGGKLMP